MSFQLPSGCRRSTSISRAQLDRLARRILCGAIEIGIEHSHILKGNRPEHATLHLRLRLDEPADHLSDAIVADERFARWCDKSSIRFVQESTSSRSPAFKCCSNKLGQSSGLRGDMMAIWVSLFSKVRFYPQRSRTLSTDRFGRSSDCQRRESLPTFISHLPWPPELSAKEGWILKPWRRRQQTAAIKPRLSSACITGAQPLRSSPKVIVSYACMFLGSIRPFEAMSMRTRTLISGISPYCLGRIPGPAPGMAVALAALAAPKPKMTADVFFRKLGGTREAFWSLIGVGKAFKPTRAAGPADEILITPIQIRFQRQVFRNCEAAQSHADLLARKKKPIAEAVFAFTTPGLMNEKTAADHAGSIPTQCGSFVCARSKRVVHQFS